MLQSGWSVGGFVNPIVNLVQLLSKHVSMEDAYFLNNIQPGHSYYQIAVCVCVCVPQLFTVYFM